MMFRREAYSHCVCWHIEQFSRVHFTFFNRIRSVTESGNNLNVVTAKPLSKPASPIHIFVKLQNGIKDFEFCNNQYSTHFESC